jgi:hypothetical protein
MTPNDAQIDLLLRRHAGQSRPQQGPPAIGDLATPHLDADELNSFAEGSLPAAARARYVSHLADCDDCRNVASQLAISGGAVVAVEAKREPQGYSWWKSLSGLFSPFNLRYAAFAAVLVAVVGVAFLVTRQQRESNFIARNEAPNQPQGTATRAADSAPPAGLVQAEKDPADKSVATSTAAATPMVNQPASKVAEDSAQPPTPAPKTGEETAPVLAAKKAAEPATVQKPPYAPPPPGEVARAGNVSTEQREMQRNAPYESRKSESSLDKAKVMDQARQNQSDIAKDRSQDDNRNVVNQSQINAQRGADNKVQLKRDEETTTRNRNERDAPAPATQSAGAGRREAAPEAPETRSAGGRKFTRQGNSWVDNKFKSSMYVKTISRESTEFDALDSGLRSIARQLGGQVIVVWKNKAYLIR